MGLKDDFQMSSSLKPKRRILLLLPVSLALPYVGFLDNGHFTIAILLFAFVHHLVHHNVHNVVVVVRGSQGSSSLIQTYHQDHIVAGRNSQGSSSLK
jgi:hypothetical protein